MTAHLSTVQQIQSLYRKLNSADRKAVQLFVNRFSGTTATKPTPKTGLRDDWLLTSFVSELHRRGLRYRQAIDPVKLAPAYEEEAAFIRDEILRQLAPVYPSPSYTQLLALGSVLAKGLADRLNRTPGGLSLKRMLNNVNKILEVVDECYPDYLASGMLYVLIQTR